MREGGLIFLVKIESEPLIFEDRSTVTQAKQKA